MLDYNEIMYRFPKLVCTKVLVFIIFQLFTCLKITDRHPQSNIQLSSNKSVFITIVVELIFFLQKLLITVWI